MEKKVKLDREGEFLDEVDCFDQVIRARSRAEIHQYQLLHRAVHIFIFNSRGELFLQRRALSKDSHPGKWDSSVSGHVDSGESYDVSAIREMEEEVGLRLQHPPEKLLKITGCEETDNEFVWLYRHITDQPMLINPAEIIEGRWFSMNSLSHFCIDQANSISPAFHYIWNRYFTWLQDH